MDALRSLFAAPAWLLAAVAAPLVGLAAWALWNRRLRAAEAWAGRALWSRVLPGWSARRALGSSLALALATAALAVGLARPRWGTTTEIVERHGIDIVFVLDTSLSMAATDVMPSRLTVAQELVRRLAAQLPGHRVALVAFEGEPLTLAPLTTDTAVLDLLLDSLEPGSLPSPGSRLDPALRAALALYPQGAKKHRALVVLSDGEDHGGALDPALEVLREEGVVASAIGIGTRAGGPLPAPAPAGESAGGGPAMKRDRDGKVVISHLRPDDLEKLARATGGVYLEATNASLDPEPLREHLAGLETRRSSEDSVSTREERFQWPLAVAAAALLLHLAVPVFRTGAGER